MSFSRPSPVTSLTFCGRDQLRDNYIVKYYSVWCGLCHPTSIQLGCENMKGSLVAKVYHGITNQ